jgi:glutaredoxin
MDSPVQRNKALFYFKRSIGFLLLLALSATFFYSAYTKSGVEFEGFYLVNTQNATNAFDSFQWTFLDLGINSMLASGIIARLMVGFELLMGFFLLFHIFLKRFTYKAVIAVLSIFIIYLLIVILKQGNTGNCGCFGNQVAMKPLTAVWKNVIMIAATIILMYIYPVKPFKYQEYVALVLAALSFSAPFFYNHIYTGTAPEAYNKPINLDPLYQYTPAPPVDLRKGKHIIAFMSLTCPHCKKAAYLLHLIHDQHPDIPIFLVLDGPGEYEKKFFDETHAGNLPYLYYRHAEEFNQLVNTGLKKGESSGVPTIFWVNNSVIEYKSIYAYYQLDPTYMVKWINKK